ncbi:MAG: OmpA family protein [Bacteroidetes bacterium]|nr:MAG: OmpA family protein [Bacteroidota bacterium]
MQRHLREVYAPNTPVQPVRAGNLGFCFLVRPLSSNSAFSRLVHTYDLRPQVNFSDVIATDGAWVKLTATFVPDQPFQYFLVGNFFTTAETPTDLSPKQNSLISAANDKIGTPPDRTKRVAYLCLDDLSLIEAPEQEPDTISLEKQLLLRKRITFSAGVLFDSGEAQLREEALPELDQVVQFMEKYPDARIGIAGHTDDVGSEAYNQNLSERRAQAVYQYLIGRGAPPERLDWKGFGEGRPVADNATESGRQQNRRVECLLLR